MARSRFFCENCGTEVRPDAKVCSNCGRFFSAVRCPNCGYTGDGKEFTHGCPNCGYSGSGFRERGTGRRGGEEWYDTADIMGGRGSKKTGRSRGRPSSKAPPDWVYWLALAIVTITFFIMVIIYVRIS